MMLLGGKNRLAVMPTYRRMCRFNIFVHLISLLAIHNYILITYSILMILQGSEYLAHIDCKFSHCRKKDFARKINHS